MSPEKLARLNAVEKAAAEMANVQAQLKEAQVTRKTMADVFDAAKAHLNTVQPAPTALQEQRRMMLPPDERARLSRIPVDPAIKEAVFAAAAAEDTFEGSKVMCRNLDAALVHARGVVARRISEWQSEFIPQTPGELIKAHLKASQARRIAGTDKPPVQERVLLCDLDRYMAGSKGPLGIKRARQGHRHPDASGPTYGPEMRGQRIAPPKVPTWNIKQRGGV